MFLKKIVISGFKSFADHSQIVFDRSKITGIVGPNGSGKSNVIDAVRWVMGEQNAKTLRGEVATDIIFAGSERRKSVAVAEVTLVFDNREASPLCPQEYRLDEEIGLTRRIYADGQRQYLINKRTCRLRDLIEFLSVAGLGGRSYSMIQQGQVDRILQARPEELREIIEEAAGTSLYKKRRNDSLRKLEDTQLSLSRVEDIRKEVYARLEQLADQVKRAQQWQEFDEQLKSEEMFLFQQSYLAAIARQEGLTVALEHLNEKEAGFLAEDAQLKSQLATEQAQLDQADPALRAMTEQITVMREKIASHESVLSNSKQRLEEWRSRLEMVVSDSGEDDEQLAKVTARRDQLETEMSAQKKRLSEIQGRQEVFSGRLAELNERESVFENLLEQLRDNVSEARSTIESGRIRLQAIDRDISETGKNDQKFVQDLSDMESDLAKKMIIEDSLRLGVDKHRAAFDQLTAEHKQQTIRLKDVGAALDEKKVARDQAQARVFGLEERIRIAEEPQAQSDLQDLLERFGLEKSNEVGILASRLKFGDCPFNKLVVSAFENWASRLIFFEFSALKKFQQQARESETPVSAPFLLYQPMSSIDEITVAGWAEGHQLQSLGEFAEGTGKRSDQIQEILGRTFVATQDSDLAEVVATMPPKVFLVDEDGNFITSSDEGTIGLTGTAGTLSMQVNVGRFRADLTREQEHVRSLNLELEGFVSESEALSKQLESGSGRIREQQEVVGEESSKLRSLRHDVNQIRKTVEQLRRDQANQSSRHLELEKTQAEISEQVAAAEQTVEHDSAELEDIQEQLEGVQETKEELIALNHEEKVAVVAAEERYKAAEDSFELNEDQVKLLSAKVAKRESEKKELTDNCLSTEQLINETTIEIKSLLDKREAEEQVLAERRNENAEIIGRMRELEQRLSRNTKGKEEIQIDKMKKQLSLEKLAASLEALEKEAFEKYEFPIQTTTGELADDFNQASQSKKVAKIRERKTALEPVNLIALKEQEELLDRQKMLDSQHDEIVKSMTTLQEAISEAEVSAEKKFLMTYDKLEAEFTKIFPILFPRGEGELKLTEPEKPLETGVEIMVRLPGKKQQAMRLFSGGEKALTAIALIFALLKSQPTPCCFLDEVDAALDESNIGRYSDLLQSLSGEFQFIVITHRRKTMEILDMLYGITMQEPGVSKVVGVDLSNVPLHLQKAFHEPARGSARH